MAGLCDPPRGTFVHVLSYRVRDNRCNCWRAVGDAGTRLHGNSSTRPGERAREPSRAVLWSSVPVERVNLLVSDFDEIDVAVQLTVASVRGEIDVVL